MAPALHVHVPGGAPPGGSSGVATTSGPGAAEHGAPNLPSPEWPPSPPPVANESDEQYLRWCNRCRGASRHFLFLRCCSKLSMSLTCHTGPPSAPSPATGSCTLWQKDLT